MVGRVIQYLLSNDADVSGQATVHPQKVKQGTTGSTVVWNIISTEPTDDKNGASTLDVIRVQIDCYASLYITAENIAGYVRAALDRQSGIIAGMNIDKIIFETQRDAFDEDSEEHRIFQEYRVRLKR